MTCVSVCAVALLDLIVCAPFSDLFLFKIVIDMRSSLTIVHSYSVLHFFSIFSWPGANCFFMASLCVFF